MKKIIPRPPQRYKECKLCKRIRYFVIVAIGIIIVAKTNPAGLKALTFITTDNLAMAITVFLGFTIVFKVIHWQFIGRHDADESAQDNKTSGDNTPTKTP